MAVTRDGAIGKRHEIVVIELVRPHCRGARVLGMIEVEGKRSTREGQFLVTVEGTEEFVREEECAGLDLANYDNILFAFSCTHRRG